jgi:CheY-like chemotaxis protein
MVDDEEQIVRIGEQFLKKLGYEVVIKTNSLEALRLFESQPDSFDLVITDMTMPNLTGTQLAEKMLKIKPDLPVILCTGFSARIDEKRIDKMGIKGYLTKPIIKKELAVTIKKVLQENRRNQTEVSLRFFGER